MSALPPVLLLRATPTVSATLCPARRVPPDAPSTSWTDDVLADQVCVAPSAVIVSIACDEVPRLSAPGDTWSVPGAGDWGFGWAVDAGRGGSGLRGSRGGETGGLPRVGLTSGWVTLAKSSSLALARACGRDRMTAVGEPIGTAPSAPAPAPARRGTTGPPPDDVAGP